MKTFIEQAPPWLRPIVFPALSLAAGLAVACILNYIFYRVGLPSTPFIYVAF